MYFLLLNEYIYPCFYLVNVYFFIINILFCLIYFSFLFNLYFIMFNKITLFICYLIKMQQKCIILMFCHLSFSLLFLYYKFSNDVESFYYMLSYTKINLGLFLLEDKKEFFCFNYAENLMKSIIFSYYFMSEKLLFITFSV